MATHNKTHAPKLQFFDKQITLLNLYFALAFYTFYTFYTLFALFALFALSTFYTLKTAKANVKANANANANALSVNSLLLNVYSKL